MSAWSTARRDYTQVVTVSGAGKMIFVAGQLARDARTIWQFHHPVSQQIGENIKTCLEAAGATLTDIVEDLLVERGLDISYETVRSRVLKFGSVIARRLQRRRPRPSDRWHLDEMVVRIAGRRMYLWRAVDHEGAVLDMLVQSRRDSRAALRLMRKLLRKQGFVPKLPITDKLRSCGSALRQSKLTCPHTRGWGE
jgi:DDE domain/Endoribonuclease L-PSP